MCRPRGSLFLLTLLIQLICSQAISRLEAAHRFDVVGILNGLVSDIHATHLAEENGNYGEIFPSLEFFHRFGNLSFDTSLISYLITSQNKQCIQDIMYISEGLSNTKNPWALHMFDSFGKLESGILEGNVKWTGNFNECRNVYAPPKTNSSAGDFHGQYCLLAVTIMLKNKPLTVTVAICSPDSCDATALRNDLMKLKYIPSLKPLIENLDYILKTATVECYSNSRPLTPGAIFSILLLTIFVTLAIIGSSVTTYEHFFVKSNADYGNNGDNIHLKEFSEDGNSETERYRGITEFFKCFCFLTNWRKLMDISSTEGQLLSIHGIRFLSMTWVIVCHVYLISFSTVGNVLEAARTIDNWPLQIILQGFYAVDSFFVLSGFLMAYLFFQESKKRDGKVAWLPFYIHRYTRLTPVYMIVLVFATTLYPFLGNGPFWPQYDTDPICKTNWWWNVLYLNNFAPSEQQCVAWSWYLANDMQFFAISPLFLITLQKWPKIGFSLLGLFFCGTFAANFGITYHYHLISGFNEVINHSPSVEEFTQMFQNFFNYIYNKPYTRIGPYLVGLALGYYLFKRKQIQRGKDNMITLTTGWIVSTTVTLACVYGLYHREQSLIELSFYNAFNRTCYAAGLAWVMYVCLTGQGGHVNGILSCKLFIPLSRLTYSAYLIHPLVVTWFFLTLKTPLFFSHSTMVTMFMGLLAITYAVALVVCLLFESPIIKLEKLVRKKLKS